MPADPPDRLALDPDEIASHSFAKTRKGYEVDEVRAYLVALASRLREAQQQRDDLERRLTEVERRAADPRDLDEEAVTEILGEETARVLGDARKAAVEIRQRAAEEVETARSEADAAARAVREGADQYAAGVRTLADEADERIRGEADAYAAATRSAADTETAAQRTEAEEYAATLRAEVDAEVAELRASTAADVERMRSEAESVLAERTTEAELVAKGIRDEADEYAARERQEADGYAEATRGAADSYRADTHAAADTYRTDATEAADRLTAEAEADAAARREEGEAAKAEAIQAGEAAAAAALEEAREAGRQMVQEARDYRERIIADLADRRRAARTQLERLAAVRDALAVSLTDVRDTIQSSHRSVVETSLDIGEVGDPGVDRRALESSEAALGLDVVGREPADPVEPVAGGVDGAPYDGADDDEDAVGSDDGADVDASGGADDVVIAADELDDQDEAASEEAELAEAAVEVEVEVEADDAEATPEEADTAGDEGGEGAASPAGEPDIDDLFARIRAGSSGDEDAAVEGEDAEAEVADAPDAASGDGAGPDAGGSDDAAPAEADAGSPEVDSPNVDAEPSGKADEDVGEEVDIDPDTDLLDRRDATTDEIERQLARRLKRVLSDEQNEVLDLLRRSRKAPDAAEVLPSEADHLARYRDAAVDDLKAAERAGAGFFDKAPRRSADVRDVAGEFGGDLVRQIRGRLEAAFVGGGDEQEVGDRIRTLYREWKTQRIADVARHYVIVAFSRGAAEAAADGSSFRWLVDHGGEAAPDCDDNALAGAVVKGEAFPTGDLCPPAHPGCRCLAVPVDADAT